MMNHSQRSQNPDVNSYQPDSGSVETPTSPGAEEDIEQNDTPLPPDTTPAAPVEEPPGSDGPPMGDVDDSPKRIA
jgi:hypothetical protein